MRSELETTRHCVVGDPSGGEWSVRLLPATDPFGQQQRTLITPTTQLYSIRRLFSRIGRFIRRHHDWRVEVVPSGSTRSAIENVAGTAESFEIAVDVAMTIAGIVETEGHRALSKLPGSHIPRSYNAP